MMTLQYRCLQPIPSLGQRQFGLHAKHLFLWRCRYPEIETFLSQRHANCSPFSRIGEERGRALSRNFSTTSPSSGPIYHHRRVRMWTRANNLAVFQFFSLPSRQSFFLHLPPPRGICAIRGTVRVVFPLPFRLFFPASPLFPSFFSSSSQGVSVL